MITNQHNNQQDPIPPLVRVCDAASLLSVSRCTVRKMIECGDLKASAINPSSLKRRRHVRVTRDSLMGFYKKRFGHSLDRALKYQFQP